MTARLLIGDARQVIPSLSRNSVDCVLSSPPYPWQRSYLPAGHPDKPLEIGQEANPGEALESLLTLMDLLWPVLADHGTYWINLGDAHSGSGGAGGDYDPEGLRAGQNRFEGTAATARKANGRKDRAEDAALGIVPKSMGNHWRGAKPGWPLDQSVCWIPQLFGASLAYGRNLLTAQEHQQWITRPPVVWAKPNPTVGATGRKFRTATEYIVYGGKRTDHFWDGDAVRVAAAREYPATVAGGLYTGKGNPSRHDDGVSDFGCDPSGRPPYNWWMVESPAQFPGAHYAVMPEGILIDPIKVGCPEKVCRRCGKPRERIVDVTRPNAKDDHARTKATGRLDGRDHPPEVGWQLDRRTLGWSDCGHNDYRPGLVLDPFAGTGTVGQVAVGHARDALLIDLDGRNREHIEGRIGMFLESESL